MIELQLGTSTIGGRTPYLIHHIFLKAYLKKVALFSKKEHSFVHNLEKNLSNASTTVCFLF